MEFRRLFVRVFLQVAQHGHAGAVLRVFHSYAQGDTDLSILRFFLSQLLGMMEPPFDPDFSAQMLDLLAVPASIEAMNRQDCRLLVAQFAGPSFVFLLVLLADYSSAAGHCSLFL